MFVMCSFERTQCIFTMYAVKTGYSWKKQKVFPLAGSWIWWDTRNYHGLSDLQTAACSSSSLWALEFPFYMQLSKLIREG